MIFRCYRHVCPRQAHLSYTYVYLVENVREDGRTKQRIIANLGRQEVVVARGDLDRLARSVARLAQRSMGLSVVEGAAPANAVCRRIGPALACSSGCGRRSAAAPY